MHYSCHKKKMFMRYRIVSLAVGIMVFCAGSVAQQTEPLPGLLSRFSPAELAGMSEQEVSWNNFLLTNWCVVTNAPDKPVDALPLISSTGKMALPSDVDGRPFNPFEWNIILSDKIQYYRVEGTDIIILAHSRARLERIYANGRNRNSSN